MENGEGTGFVGWLVGFALLVVPVWRICGRAGFHPALSLLLVIPLLGPLAVLARLAFSDWPSLRRPTRADIAATFE